MVRLGCIQATWLVILSCLQPIMITGQTKKKAYFIVIGLEFPKTSTTGINSDHREFPASIITTQTDQHGTRRIFNNTVKDRIDGTGESVTGYFDKNSYGKFEMVNAGIFGPYQADESADHYWIKREDNCAHGWKDGHGERRALAVQKFIAEEIQKRKSFDLTKYDSNKDGTVTKKELAVAIVCPQAGTYGVARGAVPKDGSQDPFTVGNISWNLYANNDGVVEMFTHDFGGNRDLGLLLHELSHVVIDADDMYENKETLPNATPPGFDPTAPGPFSLMDGDAAHAHLDYLHKKFKGQWINPIIVKKDGYYTLRPIENHPDYYKLADPNSHKGEYFIVENRQHINYDNLIPCTGLLIWHIDESRLSNYRTAAELEPPIGGKFPILWQHYCYPCTAAGSTKEFWDSSTPVNSNWHDKSKSQIGVWAIPASSNNMRVYLDVPGPGILVQITPETRQTGPNSSTSYTVKLVNTGQKTDSFDLMFNGLESSWGKLGNTLVSLKPYETKNVTFTLSLPQCPDEGKTSFDIWARSLTDSKVESKDSAVLDVQVPLQVVSADPKETNNQIGSATPVALSGTTGQTYQTLDKLTLHDAADVDFFKISYQSLSKNECLGGSTSWGGGGGSMAAFGPKYYPGMLTVQIDEEFCRSMDLTVFDHTGKKIKAYTNVKLLRFECPTNMFPQQMFYLSVKQPDQKAVRYTLTVAYSNWYITLKKPLVDPGPLWKVPPPIHWVMDPALRFYNYEDMLTQVQEWIPEFQELRARLEFAEFYLGVGEIALNMEDYERAQSLYSESLTLFEELDVKPGMAASLRGLGVALSHMDQGKDAMIQFERAMGLDVMAGNAEGIGADHMALGDHFAQTSQYEDALSQYREAFGHQKKRDDTAAMLQNVLRQAEVNLMLNRQEASVAALFRAKSLAEQTDPAAANKIDHEFSRIKSLMGEEAFGELQVRIEIYNDDTQ